MGRELALKIVLSIAGILFLATAYPMIIFIRQEPALSMMLSLYVTLGVFLLLAVRNPSAYRSLIAFAAWSSLAHATLMGTQAMKDMIAHREMIGVAFFAILGLLLLALAPVRPKNGSSRSEQPPIKTDRPEIVFTATTQEGHSR